MGFQLTKTLDENPTECFSPLCCRTKDKQLRKLPFPSFRCLFLLLTFPSSTNVTKTWWLWKYFNRPRLHSLSATDLHQPWTGFTFSNPATFRFPPIWTHLHVHLSLLATRNIRKKDTSDHTPQSTENQTGHCSPPPTNQPSPGRKLTHSAPRSSYFIKDKYITEQIELPPFELRECSDLSMKDPEIKPTLARPMTNSHLPGISSFPLALAGTPDAKQSFRSIQKFNMYKPALQPCRASIAFSQVHIRALLGIVKEYENSRCAPKSLRKSHPQHSTVNLETPIFFWVWSF